MTVIAFVGNCQAGAVRSAYERFVARRTGDTTHYLPNYQAVPPDHLEIIAKADVVVELVMDSPSSTCLEVARTQAKKYRFPLVAAGWLWPNNGIPHPHHAQKRFHVNQMVDCSDAFLNRMILADVAPREAAERYLELQAKDFRGLDRRYDLMLGKQRERDAATGYKAADMIESWFREEASFVTPYHPTLRIARYIAINLFQDMGVDSRDIERVVRFMQESFYPRLEVPIHPAVADHFGLRYISNEQRYDWLSVGPITFRDYAERYMTWDVNEILEVGLLDLQLGRPSAALENIVEGLRTSPESAAGVIGLMRAYGQLGQWGDAVAAGRAAQGWIAEDPMVRAVHGIACARDGRHSEAVEQFGLSIKSNSGIVQTYMDLSFSLWRLGQYTEAINIVMTGLELAPWHAGLKQRLRQIEAEAATAVVSTEADKQDASSVGTTYGISY